MNTFAVKRVLARPGWRLLTASVRCEPTALPPRPESGPVIFACLHRDILPAIMYVRPARPYLLVSWSPDGELLVRALAPEGFRFVRGATGEDGGSKAFRQLLRVLAGGENVGVAFDGPRGPFGSVRPGVLQLARLSGAPILPLAAYAPRAWVLHTWDRTVVPRPGSRIWVRTGEPLRLEPQCDAAALSAATERLRRACLDPAAGEVASGGA
jgi:lysophospholipid acyltransferase (LPLAT)-like uncharacterized protein